MELDRDLKAGIEEVCDEGDVLIEMGELKQAFQALGESPTTVAILNVETP